MSSAARIRVRLVKSGIGFNETQKRTLKALGLGKVGKSRCHPDNREIRGMVARVCHLVHVEPAEGSGDES